MRRVGTRCPRGFRLPWVRRVGSKCPPYSAAFAGWMQRGGVNGMPVCMGGRMPAWFADFRLPKLCVGWALVAHAGSGCLGCNVWAASAHPTRLRLPDGRNGARVSEMPVCMGGRMPAWFADFRLPKFAQGGYSLPTRVQAASGNAWAASAHPTRLRLPDGCNGAG